MTTSSHPCVVITDCDHGDILIEQQVADQAGVTVQLAQVRTPVQVIEAAAGADAVLVQYAGIDAQVIDALPRLRGVSRYGVGVDTVDVAAATARGVVVCNVPDYGTEDVSDHAIALTMTVERGTAALAAGLRAGRTDLAAVKPLHRVTGRRFGVVGFGAIGRATARKARGLGYEVVAADPTLSIGTTVADVPVVTLDELVATSAVVSLHVPLGPATRHLIDASRLARMRSDAVLVNTCRGEVVDTEALVAALRNGVIRGAGLDVTDPEPLPAGHPLLQLSQVVVTPHAAWYSEESFVELKRRAMQHAVAAALGQVPAHVVNPAALSTGRRWPR
ncbi:C-terminal binding protein [Nakamurella leprariae]|uniref:C-terminal binding protein n=1 Tax=Nakamurella leprariae TaxID=2803911 RepID=A0A938YEV6_9ACTN|nr:C-terminal binding protein [Nakamurella leprariae]MBM9468574.1 C-terminal binding protein [Nakamurella leprariae]